MLTYVLDASAYLRLALREPGETRIAEIVVDHTQHRARVVISAVQ
jgi:PIN domain nuclease of toxin-antitoxin system